MPFRPVRSIILAALIASLAACHPIDTWRSLTGADKDDPDPATTPNSQNLAAGSREPYPNLASVPAPPIPTLTQAERDRLTRSLVADRTNAKYNQEQLRPGPTPAAELPPPPPPDREHNGASPATGNPQGPAAAKSAPPPLRKPGVPPARGPLESRLQPPQPRENPHPEVSRPPPMPAPVAPAAVPPAAPIAPATIASAVPQAPPPPPSIPAPPPAPVTMAPTPATTEPAAGRTVATIDFTTSTAALTAADHAAIDRVAAAFRAKPGTVHVTAYAAAASRGHAELDNYRAALDRGQIVAKALAEDGVPVGKISTEAAPSLPNAPSGRVVIRLAS